MSLTKLEFRKIFTPMTFITLAVMLVVNMPKVTAKCSGCMK